MQRHLIIGHTIYALNYVDLAIVGPVDTLGPNARPYLPEKRLMSIHKQQRRGQWRTHGAAPGKVVHVKNPYGPKVEPVLRRDADLGRDRN